MDTTAPPPRGKNVSVEFALKTYETLERIAARKNGSMAQALRKSITLTDYVEKVVEEGGHVLIQRGGEITELLIG